MVKFLVIRFSSIGDIVLTTPVVRVLKEQVNGAVVHYLTKPAFKQVVANNPNIDKVFVLQQTIAQTINLLKPENYDYIIDLHHNLRSALIKNGLKTLSFSFNKLNIKKWLLVNFKINLLPNKHIVDRYIDTLSMFSVVNDNKGLDYFIDKSEELDAKSLHSTFATNFMAVVIGANHFTKQIPVNILASVINQSGVPVCLLGGPDVVNQANELVNMLKVPFLNTVGAITLGNSASIIKQSTVVLTPDTGLMHIAAAFKKPVLSIWGNTVPAFGMYPYMPGNGSKIFEVNNINCRPCSKIGFDKCPKKHFNCMQNINVTQIVNSVTSIIKSKK